jgi:hypothetical protein
MCCIILKGASATPSMDAALGIDIRQEIIKDLHDEIDYEANMGEGKAMAGGPTCTVRGITVPCYVAQSPWGGMTSEILAGCLAHMDKVKLFDRTICIPALFVDGHASRFELPFMEYIHDDTHKWNACHGLPYGTKWYQFHDDSTENGKGKILLTGEKTKLLRWKKANGLPATLNKTDIMPLMNRVFHQSYGDQAAGKHVLATRGINPMNRAVETHPEIVAMSSS